MPDKSPRSLNGREGTAAARPFRFVPWYMLISLISIATISVVSASALSNYMIARLLERDLEVSTGFMNAIVRGEGATSYFYGDTFNPQAPEMERFFRHVAALPDVFRANVYGHDRSVLWSSDPGLIGKKFRDNDELEAAFANVVHAELEVAERGTKAEHVGLPADTTEFVENYLRIWTPDGRQVVGAVEVYKNPAPLLASISQARMMIWIGAALAGLALFASLTLIVRYASRLLRAQETRLIEAERLAVVGEMASAVAHGLRNPLAAIRSCAELALEDRLEPDTRRSVLDIVDQSDRLETWIRSFLTRARHDPAGPQTYKLDDIIRESVEAFRPQMEARTIRGAFDLAGDSPLVGIDPPELNQVLNSLLANSIEAIEKDGEIRVERRHDGNGAVEIHVVDSGPGLPVDRVDKLFQDFQTGKAKGLGVGLSLARRTIERLGGTLTLTNADGGGARAVIRLPSYEVNA